MFIIIYTLIVSIYLHFFKDQDIYNILSLLSLSLSLFT